jgi:hypothetical protein
MLDATMQWPRCLYCEVRTVPGLDFVQGLHEPGHLRTRDHVFPRWMVARFPGPLPTGFLTPNAVWCCVECNQAKGPMHPLDWASLLPSVAGARVQRRVAQLIDTGAVPPEWHLPPLTVPKDIAAELFARQINAQPIGYAF